MATWGGGHPTGINDSGQVVGSDYIGVTSTGAYTVQAELWQPGSTTPIVLGGLGANYSSPAAINNRGQIVGSVDFNAPSQNNTANAVIWQPGSTTPLILGGLGGNDDWPAAINANGQVVGNLQGNGTQAVLWQAGSTTPTVLDGFGGTTAANSINVSGEVVGSSIGAGNTYAVVWQPGSITPTILENTPTIPTTIGAYQQSWATAINDNGEILGVSNGYNVLWQPGSTTPIVLGGSLSGTFALNNLGEVVGASSFAGSSEGHAALWQPGSTTPIDLNTLISLSSGYLIGAWGVNDNGQIVALDSNGNAVLLTPVVAVPLPAAFLLFGSALAGFVGLIRSKTK